MHRRQRFVCLVFLVCALDLGAMLSCAFAQPGPVSATTTAAHVQTTEPATTSELGTASEIERLRARNAILEARDEIENSAYARLEILIAVLGAVLAVVIVAFAFRTERMAVAAATKAIEEERKEIAALLATARSTVEQIQTHELQAAQASERVTEIVRKAIEGKALNEGDRQALTDAAAEISSKPSTDLSEREFVLRIAEAVANEESEKVLELTRAFRRLHRTETAISTSLDFEVGALIELNRPEEAIDVSIELEQRFGDSPQTNARGHAIGVRVGHTNALTKLGRLGEAHAVLDEFFERANETPLGRANIGRAHYNRACLYALAGDVDKVSVELEKMIASDPSLNKKEVEDDSDFDAIREDPKFKAVVKRLWPNT